MLYLWALWGILPCRVSLYWPPATESPQRSVTGCCTISCGHGHFKWTGVQKGHKKLNLALWLFACGRLLSLQKAFTQSESSTDSNFSLSAGSQAVKSRNVAIQTNCKPYTQITIYGHIMSSLFQWITLLLVVDDHLSTTVEPEVVCACSHTECTI